MHAFLLTYRFEFVRKKQGKREFEPSPSPELIFSFSIFSSQYLSHIHFNHLLLFVSIHFTFLKILRELLIDKGHIFRYASLGA